MKDTNKTMFSNGYGAEHTSILSINRTIKVNNQQLRKVHSTTFSNTVKPSCSFERVFRKWNALRPMSASSAAPDTTSPARLCRSIPVVSVCAHFSKYTETATVDRYSEPQVTTECKHQQSNMHTMVTDSVNSHHQNMNKMKKFNLDEKKLLESMEKPPSVMVILRCFRDAKLLWQHAKIWLPWQQGSGRVMFE